MARRGYRTVSADIYSNYFNGSKVDATNFDKSDTTPIIAVSGQHDQDWEKLRAERADELWTDPKLLRAGTEFARLVKAQRAAFAGSKLKPSLDQPEKALNAAILAAWAYVAGILHNNDVRLNRHYALADATGRDPLNANALSTARHRTDPDTYRGLGTRTDAKDRGRLAELFFIQAESGDGVTKKGIDLAMAKYYAKQAQQEAAKVEARRR